LTLVFLSAGCGPPAVGTPSQILKKAIEAQGNLNSVRVDIDSEIELDIPGGARSSLLSYKGFFEKPDRWKLAARSSGEKSDVVIIGQRTWVKLFGSDAWIEKKAATPLICESPDDVIASKYLKSARDARLIDRKGDTYHLKFDLNILTFARAFNLPGVDPALLKGKEVHMEIWVRKDKLYLEKARMEFASHLSAPVNGNLNMTQEIEFSNFNDPVSIEPPT